MNPPAWVGTAAETVISVLFMRRDTPGGTSAQLRGQLRELPSEPGGRVPGRFCSVPLDSWKFGVLVLTEGHGGEGTGPPVFITRGNADVTPLSQAKSS